MTNDETEKKRKNSILIVDDEPSNINILIHLLWDDYTLHVAKDGASALNLARIHLPDLILLDIILPEMDGYTVLENLRKFSSTKNIPVIFISGLSSIEDEEKGLALEIADYISKPFVPTIVKLRVSNQMRMLNYLRTIERLSMTDVLTGLNNRRSFNERLRQEWSLAIRERIPLSLIMLDVDNFKNYNDTYGHQQGDMALKSLAEVLTNCIKRSSDFVARWGGEEFIVLLPSTDLNGAKLIAERLRTEVEQTPVPLPNGELTTITVSAGITKLTPRQDSMIDKFISDADKALYIAKDKGRNMVVAIED